MSKLYNIDFIYNQHISYTDYDVFIQRYENVLKEEFNSYIIRFDNNILYIFEPYFGIKFNSMSYCWNSLYDIPGIKFVGYTVHIYDENKMDYSYCNILLTSENNTLFINSINHENNTGGRWPKYYKYWFQILCQKYMSRLICDHKQIFTLLFNQNFEYYKVKIQRGFNINIIMDFNEYLSYKDEEFPLTDHRIGIKPQSKELCFIINQEKCDYEYTFRSNDTLHSFYKDQHKIYNIISRDELKKTKDIIMYEYYENQYEKLNIYYNRTEYEINKDNKLNTSYLIYDKNHVICYSKIGWIIKNIHKISNEVILFMMTNCDRLNFKFKHVILKNKPRRLSFIRCILDLESENYDYVNEYIIGNTNNID